MKFRISIALIIIAMVFTACGKKKDVEDSAKNESTTSVQTDLQKPELKPATADADMPEGKNVLITFLDAENGKKINISYEIYPSGNRDNKLESDMQNTVRTSLEAGTYDMKVSWGTGSNWITGMEVQEGSNAYTVNMNLGTLNLSFVNDSGEKDNVSFEIYPTGNSEQKLLSNFQKDLMVLLPGGKYDISCKKGDESWRVEGIEVTAGQTLNREITIE